MLSNYISQQDNNIQMSVIKNCVLTSQIIAHMVTPDEIGILHFAELLLTINSDVQIYMG